MVTLLEDNQGGNIVIGRITLTCQQSSQTWRDLWIDIVHRSYLKCLMLSILCIINMVCIAEFYTLSCVC